MMKILFAASECMPFAATGGLGDVIGSLPRALRDAYGPAADIRVVLPLYECIPPSLRQSFTKEAVFTVRLSWRRQYCGLYSLRRDGIVYYFIDNEYYFGRQNIYGYPDDGERYAFFSMAVLDMLAHIGFFPDILHAHDWQGALSVIYKNLLYGDRQGYARIKTVFTIHNIEYQGQFPTYMLEDVFALSAAHRKILGWRDDINLMQGAVILADQITTVSPTYAKEIQTPALGRGLDSVLRAHAEKLSGILNGIDDTYYNPAADAAIAKPYTKDTAIYKKANKISLQQELNLPQREDIPVFSVISRLVGHKGTELICTAAKRLLQEEEAQLVLLGTGDEVYEAFFHALEDTFPEKMRALIKYDRDLSKRIYAASDFFLMPSASEPCGLSQMIACRYGAIPIVRETGGLSDSIHPFKIENGKVQGSGLTFMAYDTDALYERILQALEIYKDEALHRRLTVQVMEQDYSWKVSAGAYMRLYNGLSAPKKG
ncbi:MAG: glycogen synthase GlgA [Clostridiales bacterium]|nr:glycogen synthase GlgA [Clostridiales bacterium]